MATDTVHQAIRDRLDSLWTTTPLAYENEPTPWEKAGRKQCQDAAGKLTPWVDVEIVGTLIGTASIGSGSAATDALEETGSLFLHVMVPRSTGRATAGALARQLWALFRGVELLDGSLRFGDGSIGQGRPGEADGNWWILPLSIEWDRISD